jgi:hypothetical protein
MVRQQNWFSILWSAVGLVAMFSWAIVEPSCSSRTDSLPAVGSTEDYLAQRQNNAYAYGYGPFALCAAYDPFCFAPNSYPAAVYYYSSDDGDNDCDDGKCRGSGGRGPHKPAAGSTADRNPPTMVTSSSTSVADHELGHAPSMSTVNFGENFGTGFFGGHGRR